MKKLFILCTFCMAIWSPTLLAQKGSPPEQPTSATVATHFPKSEVFTEDKVKALRVHDGFRLDVVATGLGKPRMMVIDDHERLYITRRDQGDVLLLKDTDNDGKFDDLQTVVTQFKGVHGIAIHNGYLYLVSNRELKRGKISTDGSVARPELLLNDLPDGGQHGNRTIAFGPDGKLYITIGSTCNDCNETNKENATLLVADADGKKRKIYARGLRNTIGIDWHPATGELWGADNGTDWRGDTIPPEEINQIKEGKDYGWPFVYGKQEVDETREDPMGTTKKEYATTTEPSMLDLPAHSAPINLLFLGRVKDAPKEYRDDAIVTLHGSWNKQKPDGYKIVRIKFENGKPTGYDEFLGGFLSADGTTRLGRPAGLAISSKGKIYVSDDGNGVIYSMSYVGNEAAKK